MGEKGWSCGRCTFKHEFPATRCVMCHALRTTKEQLIDFVRGVPIPESSKVNAYTVRKEAARVQPVNRTNSQTQRTKQTSLPPIIDQQSHQPSAEEYFRRPSLSCEWARTAVTSISRHRSALAVARKSGHSPTGNYTKHATADSTTDGTCRSVNNPAESTDASHAIKLVSRNFSNNKETPSYPDPSASLQEETNNRSSRNRGPSLLRAPPHQNRHLHWLKNRKCRSNGDSRAVHQVKGQSANTRDEEFLGGLHREKRERPYKPGPVPFDESKIHQWIYPVHPNYSKRDYQVQMSKTALFQNTLVSLPTGLGKTMIAAVVLYNYYRWFPTGKLIFCAPTQPLVLQQVEACYNLVGIPLEDTAVLTGRTRSDQRKAMWKERRVFFCTPQTIQNDINKHTANIPCSKVVCCVLDEAHKASGDHAYVKVVELLEQAGAKFRLVGLSATPGSGIEAVQNVINVLKISTISCFTDDDKAIQLYTHNRELEVIEVEESSLCKSATQVLLDLLRPHLRKCQENGYLTSAGSGATISSYSVLREIQSFKERRMQGGSRCHDSLLSTLVVVRTVIDWRERLSSHGVGNLRKKMQEYVTKPMIGVASTMKKDEKFRTLLTLVKGATESSQGHADVVKILSENPKMMKLKEVLKEHFARARAVAAQKKAGLDTGVGGEKACRSDAAKLVSSTRAIVFSQFRDSVVEIVKTLDAHRPWIRPTRFVGQSKGCRSKDREHTVERELKGMNQAEQQKVLRCFREGEFNVLVCTSIGEEGLDIGEVDLIVNFDSLNSPIRMLQRVGRTGRARDGRVVSILTKPEVAKYRASKSKEKTLLRVLKHPTKLRFHPNDPMFPGHRQPVKCIETALKVGVEFRFTQLGGEGLSRRKRRSAEGDVVLGTRTETRCEWKLTETEERVRRQVFGNYVEQCCTRDSSSECGFPVSLRQRLLKARTISCRAQTPTGDTRFQLGTTLLISRILQDSHGDRFDSHSVSLPSSFKRDDESIRMLFRAEMEFSNACSLSTYLIGTRSTRAVTLPFASDDTEPASVLPTDTMGMTTDNWNVWYGQPPADSSVTKHPVSISRFARATVDPYQATKPYKRTPVQHLDGACCTSVKSCCTSSKSVATGDAETSRARPVWNACQYLRSAADDEKHTSVPQTRNEMISMPMKGHSCGQFSAEQVVKQRSGVDIQDLGTLSRCSGLFTCTSAFSTGIGEIKTREKLELGYCLPTQQDSSSSEDCRDNDKVTIGTWSKRRREEGIAQNGMQGEGVMAKQKVQESRVTGETLTKRLLPKRSKQVGASEIFEANSSASQGDLQEWRLPTQSSSSSSDDTHFDFSDCNDVNCCDIDASRNENHHALETTEYPELKASSDHYFSAVVSGYRTKHQLGDFAQSQIRGQDESSSDEGDDLPLTTMRQVSEAKGSNASVFATKGEHGYKLPVANKMSSQHAYSQLWVVGRRKNYWKEKTNPFSTEVKLPPPLRERRRHVEARGSDESGDLVDATLQVAENRVKGNFVATSTPQVAAKKANSRSPSWSNLADTRILSGSKDSGGLTDTPPERHLENVKVKDVFCAVCLSGESPEDDPIVLCDGDGRNETGCLLAVHKTCCSIESKLVEDLVWRCSSCCRRHRVVLMRKIAKCCICQSTKGPLKRLSRRLWHHPYCVVSSNMPHGSDNDNDDDGMCIICDATGAVPCGKAGCTAALHPHCVIISMVWNGKDCWTLLQRIQGPTWDTGPDRRLMSFIFCEEDSEEGHKIALNFQMRDALVVPPSRFSLTSLCKSQGNGPGTGSRLKRFELKWES